MLKNLLYLKQAWQLMKQNRFYTVVYLLGTGLAISLVMTMAIVYHIKSDDIAPESNRSRMLISDYGIAINENSQTSSALSYQTIKACFYSLETPECVSAFTDINSLKYYLGDIYVSYPGSSDKLSVALRCTDADYWKIFRFSFEQGKPYNEEEFQSGFKKAVLSESTARKLFNTTDAEGKKILVNDVEYTVGGVVKDVSPAMCMAFADMWIPFTAISTVCEAQRAGNICGILGAYILAKKSSDFDAIRAELEQKRQQYNASLSEYEYTLGEENPFTQRQVVIKSLGYRTHLNNYNEIILRYALVALLFLLVPAVNLSGLTSSRMQERTSEIGIRKAFGASRGTIIHQALTENLFLTLLGGLIGLIISGLIVWGMSGFLILDKYTVIQSHTVVSIGMLLNFTVFFYALCVCVILNLLSSLLPVRSASRKQIMQAINDK
jgi:putative ABC transport system permease protein